MGKGSSGIILLLLTVAVSLPALCDSAAAALLVPEGKGPGGQALYTWGPGESSLGGDQYDPRLGISVQCWRATVSLSDIFASIAEQTGVSIGFWPPDDQNARVRVNVFLNADDPPALGDLMAQLSWVTDCAFGCTGSGSDTKYYLLSTSIAQGAAAGLQQREAEARKRCADLVQAFRDRTAQLQEALALPREDAIARYAGRDDALLLTVLDPVRRAAAQVAMKGLSELLETIQFNPALPPNTTQGFGTGIYPATIPQEDKDAVATAFPDWHVDYNDPNVYCMLFVGSDGGVRLGPPHHKDDPYESWGKAILPVMDVSHGIDSRPADEIELRRLMGEAVSPADEEAYVAVRKAEIAATENEREDQRRAAGRYLSDEMRETLASAALPLSIGACPAWRVEEEVARATGLHIVADALLDATADIQKSPDEVGGVAALHALEAFCAAPGRNFMRTPEWEWGDAGPFLTFRTSNRDVWRAAMLPQSLLDWLDTQIAPRLPKAAQGRMAAAAELDLPVEPEQWTRWLSTLNRLQIEYGAVVPCGEVGDPADVVRRATWKAAFALAEFHPTMLRFLGSLNSGQWGSVRAGKLRGPQDLSSGQMQSLRAAADERGSWSRQLPEGSSILMSITQGACESNEMRAGGGYGAMTYPEGIAGAGDWYRLNITAENRLEGEDKEGTVLEKQVPFLPVSIHVRAGAGN